MAELGQDAQRLSSSYRKWHESLQATTEPTISVDEVAARVASFYEKIRGVVDWREEHLLRKTAIERILKRRLFLGSVEDFAEPFVLELIRGGHFPNEQIPVKKIEEVQAIVEKYTYLLENSPQEAADKVLAERKMWVLSIAAAEIEETLAPPIKEHALFEYMLEDMVERVHVKGTELSEEEVKLQLSVAVQRALFKLDEATITYHLLEQQHPDWHNPSPETLQSIAGNLSKLQDRITHILFHKRGERFYQLMERYDAPYLIVGDVLTEHPTDFKELAQDRSAMESAIGRAYTTRQGKLQGRMKRAAFYSTLSVFITKVLVAFAIEIPFDKYVTGEFNSIAIVASIVVPPLLMLLLVLSTRTSSKENFQRLMLEVMKIVYGTKQLETLELTLSRKRRPSMEGFLNFLYLSSFLLSFGALSWLLRSLEFSWSSIVVFLFFVSLVAFAGTRIRQRGRELLLGEEKQGILYTVFDLFSLPIIHTGKWLSRQVARYNILIVFMNFLVEIPFQVFVEFLEHWRSFLREKREEVH